MKYVVQGLVLGLMALCAPVASHAASVISTKTLSSTAVATDLKAAPVAPYAGGTLTVTVQTTSNAPSNPSIFVALDSFNIGTVRAVDLVAGSLPGVATLSRVFSINTVDLNSILADSQVLFKFRSGTASERNPYKITAVLSYASVPEPASMAIVGLGACALAGFARRRRM